MKPLNLESAQNLLREKVQNENLRRHCMAVGYALRGLREYYISQNLEVGPLTPDQWEICGILHDSDWEQTTNNPEKHTLVLMKWLKEYETPSEMLEVFESHNNHLTHLREPQTLIEKSLECCDELTGFIVAVTLVLPSKKIAEVDVARVLKKFKQKEFARAVDRDQIAKCDALCGVSLDVFVGVVLKSMQNNAESLGL